MEKTDVKRHWAHRIKAPGKHLPKRLLRPFVVPTYHRLDEKQLALVAEGDKRNWVNMLRGFSYAFAAGGGATWAAFHFKEPISLSVAIIALTLSFVFKYLENTIKPTRFIIFDREQGTVSFPLGWTSGGGRATFPWNEMVGRLSLGPTVAGESRHLLIMVHRLTGHGPILMKCIMGIDYPLGVWSFLVQYMDKDGPLPNVPELAHCPNLTDGLKESDKDWFEQNDYGSRSDPYYEWLAELKANPELDELNAEIERRRQAG